jgi:hypothetical protein
MDTDTLPLRFGGIVYGGIFGLIGLPLGILLGLNGWWLPIFMIGFGTAAGFAIRHLMAAVSHGVAMTVARSVVPTGKSTPYAKAYSYEQSLAARGDVAGSIEAYDEAMLDNATDPEPRVQAAELLMRHGNAARAAELFREARRLAGNDRARELYTTQRLIDLYLGPLDDPGRATVELRRLADRFAGTREAEAARNLIVSLKREPVTGRPPRLPRAD